MLPNFVNRKEELEFLNLHHKSKTSEFIVLYGRRRVGKTELIQKFIDKKKATYFLATKDTTYENINEFKKTVSKQLNLPILANIKTTNWLDILKTLAELLDDKTKSIIVIDEFSYLIEINSAVPSIFQKAWDEYLKNKNIMLILCGSSISMMEEQVLGYQSPLYGRRTGQWRLNALQINHLKKFIPKYNIEDTYSTFFILGGIPAYLTKWDDKKTLLKNIEENILSKGQFLYDEANFLLKQEFREQWIYALILKKLSLGYNSLSKLYTATNMDKSNLSKYLHTLEKLSLIRHILPLGKRKGGIYIISDEYFDFWFKFVYDNMSLLESGRKDTVLDKIKKEFSTYSGKRFEYLVEKMILSGNIKMPIQFSSIEKWWHKEKEIDLVALNDETKDILFVECKWKTLKNTEAKTIIEDLKQKAKEVNWNNNTRKNHFAIIAKKIENKEQLKHKGILAYDLDDF